jgi:hypothetical protein
MRWTSCTAATQRRPGATPCGPADADDVLQTVSSGWPAAESIYSALVDRERVALVGPPGLDPESRSDGGQRAPEGCEAIRGAKRRAEDSERPKGAKLSEERSDENTERPLGAKVTRDQRIMRARTSGRRFRVF